MLAVSFPRLAFVRMFAARASALAVEILFVRRDALVDLILFLFRDHDLPAVRRLVRKRFQDVAQLRSTAA